MVRGRLPRESNPVPGQSQPGFVPAFDETGNEDYVRVSNQKPYPVANYTQNPSGVWLPTSQNNPMPTQITGSIGAKSVGEEMVVHEDEITIAPNSSIVLESAELARLAGKTKIRVYLLRPSQDYRLQLMSRLRPGTGWASEAIEDNGSSTSTTGSSTYDLEFPISTYETPRLRIINRNTDEEMTVDTTVIIAI